jgi:rubredoxin
MSNPDDITCPTCGSDDLDLTDDELGCECAECGHVWDVSDEDEDFSDPMDGDHESALASAGLGTDESYGGGSDIDTDYGDDY